MNDEWIGAIILVAVACVTITGLGLLVRRARDFRFKALAWFGLILGSLASWFILVPSTNRTRDLFAAEIVMRAVLRCWPVVAIVWMCLQHFYARKELAARGFDVERA